MLIAEPPLCLLAFETRFCKIRLVARGSPKTPLVPLSSETVIFISAFLAELGVASMFLLPIRSS